MRPQPVLRGPDRSIDRRRMLGVMGATAVAGLVPGCVETPATAVDGPRATASDALPVFITGPIESYDETELVQETTRLLSDVLRDVEAGRRSVLDEHLARSARLFARGQGLLKTKYKAKIRYGILEESPESGDVSSDIDLTLLPPSASEIDRDCAEALSGMVTIAITEDEKKVVVAILSVLGVSSYTTTFLKLVPASYWTSIAGAIRRSSWGVARTELGRLLGYLISPAFQVALRLELTVAVAVKIIAKILSLLIPFVGWTILIARLIVQLAKLALG